MDIIRYNEDFFFSSNQIQKLQYDFLKEHLTIDEDFSIAKGESVDERFRKNKKIRYAGAIIAVLGYIILKIFKENLPFLAAIVSYLIFGIIGLGILITVIAELYVHRSKLEFLDFQEYSISYFKRMKTAIINSENYEEFVKLFYHES